MPNLQQIIALKDKYGSKNRINNRQLSLLGENFTRSFDQIKNSLSVQGLDSSMLTYFENQVSANLVMLFIDITGFSNICKEMSNSRLANYLDRYYDVVIPVIYQHGGEIEKIIGDGVIAIFGQPFLSDDKLALFKKADACAKDIIMLLKATDKEVKIALHDGNVMYYKNKPLNYPEYTVIGKPLTELFRLESVALNNSISFYHISSYSDQPYCVDGAYCITSHSPITCGYFNKSNNLPIQLQGVDWSFIKHFTCTYRQ
jgi:hypothetical protein